jgi:hypothetical protein
MNSALPDIYVCLNVWIIEGNISFSNMSRISSVIVVVLYPIMVFGVRDIV